MEESEEKMWFKVLDRFSSIKKDLIFAFIIMTFLFGCLLGVVIFLWVIKANYYTISLFLVALSISLSILVFTVGLLISIFQRYGLVKYEEETIYLLKEINGNIKKLIEKDGDK